MELLEEYMYLQTEIKQKEIELEKLKSRFKEIGEKILKC